MNFDGVVWVGFSWFKLVGVGLMMLVWGIVFIYGVNDGIER